MKFPQTMFFLRCRDVVLKYATSVATIFILISSFSFISMPSHAQFLTGSRSAGAGGAGRASVDPIEAVFLNPANLAQLKKYYIGFQGADSQDVSSGQNREASLAIADGTPDKLFTGGLAVTRRRVTSRGSTPIEQTNYQVGAANFLLPNLSLGAAVHRLESDFEGGAEHIQHNFNLGALWTPFENLGLAVVGYDLLRPSSDIPSEIALQPTVGAGMTLIYKEFFRWRLDITHPLKGNPESDSILMTGFESVLAKLLTLRLGAQWQDVSKQTFLTSGFSWEAPRFALNYAFQKELQPSPGGNRHVFDLTFSF